MMRKDLFDELIESVKQMKKIQAGRLKPSSVFRGDGASGDPAPDVAKLRGEFKLSQKQFAALLGINVDTLQNWEQRRRSPEGPARVLLRVAAMHPEALLAVSGARHLGKGSSTAGVAESGTKYSATGTRKAGKPGRARKLSPKPGGAKRK
jgi:putative transcriptional regulator